MGKTILIGNGINICKNKDLKSEKLMSTISKQYINNEETNELINKIESFSLKFEAILTSIDKGISKDKIFASINKEINCLTNKNCKNKNNPVYAELSENPILQNKQFNIITTNYDFEIEKGLFNMKQFKRINSKTRNKGFIYENYGHKIFHIHGDLNHYKNICLGEISYNKYLKSYTSSLKNNLLDKIKDENNYKKFLEQIYSELNSFFEDDILIIGLDLSPAEKIIWSMILFRNIIIKNNLSLIKNKITYIDIIEDKTDNQVEKNYFTLFNIDYQKYNLKNSKGNSYEEAYIDCIKKFLND